MKRESHLVTYQSGENQSQIDYILVKQQNIKSVRDLKVIPNVHKPAQTTCLWQKNKKNENWCKKFVPKWRLWKLQQSDFCDKFCETFTGEIYDTSGEQVDDIWSRLKRGLLSTAGIICGWT